MQIRIGDVAVYMDNSYKNITLINIAGLIGYSVPHFCYHEKLMLAGNCRACLGLIEKERKPSPLCVTLPRDNMNVLFETKYKEIAELRENVLEFMLFNHSIDCAACDQGGECELQDICFLYGNSKNTYYFKKHCFENKNCGNLIKTVMNRCIHCTRCVRFAKDLAGFSYWGLTGRGSSMEIGNYINSYFDSEVSGNVTDLCPVGALTLKPYSFTSRPWDLNNVSCIDLTDGLGSNISINSRGSYIYKIVPQSNDKVNGCWISDKARFSFENMLHNRIASPVLNNKTITWEDAFNYLRRNVLHKGIHANEFTIYLNNNFSSESMLTIKLFFNQLGISKFNCNNLKFNTDFSYYYRGSDLLRNVDKYLNACLIVGCDLRDEGAVLNIKYRQKYLKGYSYFYQIGGSISNFNYACYHVSSNIRPLVDYAEGRHMLTCDFTRKYTIFNHVVFSSYLFVNNLFHNFFSFFRAFFRDVCTTFYASILYNEPNVIGNLDINFNFKFEINQKFVKNLFLINVSNFYQLSLNDSNLNFLKNKFVVYIGSIANNFIKNCNLILPCSHTLQHLGFYVNVDGTPQIVDRVAGRFGKARQIYNLFSNLNSFFHLTEMDSNLSNLVISYVPYYLVYYYNDYLKIGKYFVFLQSKNMKLSKIYLKHPHTFGVKNYYLTNSIY